MSVDFTVDRIALHRMDKAANTIEKANQTVDLTKFKKEDRDAIEVFFSDHLRRVWEAPEGSNNISAATFDKNSGVLQGYRDIVKNSNQFLTQSQQMADSLFKEAPATSSPGVLMTLWVRKKGDKRPFLVLFKMDPGRSNKIALRLQGNQVLLDLAVQHIDQALPDTGERVLKWAVTPHPTRDYDVKVRDSQGKQKAIYFMKFLGCEARKSEKEQIAHVMRVLPAAAVGRLMQEVTPLKTVDIDAIRKSQALTTNQIAQVENQLAAVDSKDLHISSKRFLTTKLTYRLDNGIVLKGPWAAMRNVAITQLGPNDWEFQIRTTGYKTSYE